MRTSAALRWSVTGKTFVRVVPATEHKMAASRRPIRQGRDGSSRRFPVRILFEDRDPDQSFRIGVTAGVTIQGYRGTNNNED
jgi:hypothetical protein